MKNIKPYIAGVSIGLLTLALNACNSTSSGPAPVPPSPTPAASPTVVPIPAASPFTSTTTVTSVSTSAAAVTLPPAGGFTGSIDFGVPTNSFPAGTTVSTTVSNVAPSSIVTLASLLRKQLAERKTLSANGAIYVLTYDDVLFSNAVTYGNAPSFTITVPTVDVVTAAYYLAEYDPTRPSLGWQLGFEGPAKLSGSTFTFTTLSFTPFTFAANAHYYFALYAISTSAATPTPAPSIAPIAPATATPTPSSSASPTAPGSTPTPVPDVSPTPTATPVPDQSAAP